MDMDHASGSGARHGSGARLSSREPRRERTRQTSEAGTRLRATPAGPQEHADWLEALNASSNRFDTLERLVRNQAQIISNLEASLIEHNNRINDHANKLERLNTGCTDNDKHLREVCANVVDRYFTLEQARTMDEKVDLISAQIQAVMSAVASTSRPIMTAIRHGSTEPATEFHNVSTPRNSDPQQ